MRSTRAKAIRKEMQALAHKTQSPLPDKLITAIGDPAFNAHQRFYRSFKKRLQDNHVATCKIKGCLTTDLGRR